MTDTEQNQLRKLRRRIEEQLRNSVTPKLLIRIAELCNIRVPKNLRERYMTSNDD